MSDNLTELILSLILVDEFQDIWTGRARLIKALKAQHSDAKVWKPITS